MISAPARTWPDMARSRSAFVARAPRSGSSMSSAYSLWKYRWRPIGGQGPLYPVPPPSWRPSRAPAGSPEPLAPSMSVLADAGMLYTTQCTQTRVGAAGSGASGSSTMSARLRAPCGTPLHASGGEMSGPSQVKRDGIAPSATNAGEENVSIMSPCSKPDPDEKPAFLQATVPAPLLAGG